MNTLGASPMAWAGCAIAASDQRAARTRRKVMAALGDAIAPVSIYSIAAMSGISYFSARRALLTLVAMHAVDASGPANNRRYALSSAGRGDVTGGPASESAAGASAGSVLTPAARPGSEAA